MKVNNLLTIVAFILAGITLVTTETGCAGMTPPTGGPRDSLPPLIVNVSPRDSTLGFNSKKIEINFNEYVQVEDVQQNLLVSPTPKVNPTVEARLRTVTVTIRDTLEENTTYAIDFGNAIRDFTESNIFRGYRYIFSTGRTIDSLQLAGKVIIAETGTTDSTLIVMLHTSFDDSAVAKERPRYVARVDTSGFFQFDNLAPGTYAIYALKDEGGSRRYLSKDQLFAFSDSAVTSQSQKKDILLYAFVAEDTAKKEISPLSEPAGTGRRRPAANTGETLRVLVPAEGEGQDLLSNLDLIFDEPLRNFDSTKIAFLNASYSPITGYHFLRDTSGKKVSLVNRWIENTTYHLVLDTAFAEDTLGRHIARTDTITFTTKKNSDYGLVRLRFLNLPLNQNPVLQFVQGGEVKRSHVFTNNQFYAPLFIPGDYDLRLVFDENRNGKWDTGEFFGRRKQPEKVQRISRKLTIKPNWDTEVDIQL